MSLLFWIPLILLTVIIILAATTYTTRKIFQRRKIRQKQTDPRTAVAFFHPYCNAGGGGERVLWCGIQALQNKFPEFRYVIYSGDSEVTPAIILNNVAARFNIHILLSRVEFIFLKRRSWIEAHHYPHLTLLCQSLGSIILGLEALNNFVPDTYIDTMGYAFTYPIFKILGHCKTAAYIHYPTVSTDMLARVSNGVEAHNNNVLVAQSRLFTTLKIVYYHIFAWVYSWAGHYSDVVMVNSSWTKSHINALWRCPSKTHRVFPPCDVIHFTEIPLESGREDKLIKVVSIAQFRPEKDHLQQLKAMAELRKLVNPEMWERIRFVLIGSCRNMEDECRVDQLRYAAAEMQLENNVEFKLNVSFEDLKSEMAQGLLGIHTMWNEHFGIGIVECMAAGLIMVAHNSGGPMMDIVETREDMRTGFLATTSEEYAQTLHQIIQMSQMERTTIRYRARASLHRFSEEAFTVDFLNALSHNFAKQ